MNRPALFLAILISLVGLALSTFGVLTGPVVLEWAKIHQTETILGATIFGCMVFIIVYLGVSRLREPVK